MPYSYNAEARSCCCRSLLLMCLYGVACTAAKVLVKGRRLSPNSGDVETQHATVLLPCAAQAMSTVGTSRVVLPSYSLKRAMVEKGQTGTEVKGHRLYSSAQPVKGHSHRLECPPSQLCHAKRRWGHSMHTRPTAWGDAHARCSQNVVTKLTMSQEPTGQVSATTGIKESTGTCFAGGQQ